MRELSLNVMDIAQNSISAGAKLIEICVCEDTANGTLSIEIADNGRGMTQEQVESVTDPFYTTRTTRKVGLGVPLFKMEAEMTGGNFEISSKVGEGTVLKAVFVMSSIDMIPLGDIDSTVHLLIICNPQLDFVYRRILRTKDHGEREFCMKTSELRDVLGEDVPLDAPEVAQWIKEYISENTNGLFE